MRLVELAGHLELPLRSEAPTVLLGEERLEPLDLIAGHIPAQNEVREHLREVLLRGGPPVLGNGGDFLEEAVEPQSVGPVHELEVVAVP